MPDVIQERYRKLRRLARRLTAESSMSELHEVRVRAKKLHYALEAVAPTYAKPADEMLAALRKLQSRLGTKHDADVIARHLTQVATDPPPGFTAATLFLMGRLVEAHAREAARMGNKVERSWRKLHGRRWKALRARMELLRDEAAASNDKDRRIGHTTRGNGKLGGAAARGAFPEARGR